jgi:hypothetical protein
MAKRTKSSKNARNNPVVAASRAASGMARERHFAEGGTVAAWRGRARRIQPDSPAARSKAACRSFRYTAD